MKKNLFQFFCLLYFPFSLSAQSDSAGETVGVRPKYCNPTVEGMGPSKAASILYERAGNANITSVSRDTSIGNDLATIRRNNRFNIDLKIPVINKPNLKIIAGLRYFYEEFTFKRSLNFSDTKSLDFSDYALYRNLENKHLKSIGTNISILKSRNETKYWVARLMADLNGDYTNERFPKSSFLKVSFAFLYGQKKCKTKTTAAGLYLNYSLGRQSVFPVFLYNNTFSKHWGVEALAPAYIKGRYNFSDKALLYFGYEVEGASYNLFINNPEMAKYSSLQLRRSTIRYEVQLEKEITKFIWISISGGLRQTLNFNVTTKNDKPGSLSFHNGIQLVKGDPLIRNTLAPAPFINVSVFAVVPKVLLNKIVYTKEKDE
jgi:hypothetical protein